MAKLKTMPFDPAEYLTTPRALAIYMSEALETGDPAYIMHALGVVARAKGMAEIARQTGLGRESLYKALREGGNPEFGTVIRVMRALGLSMAAKPRSSEGQPPRRTASRPSGANTEPKAPRRIPPSPRKVAISAAR
jgi:probable addiction module antidote protein